MSENDICNQGCLSEAWGEKKESHSNQLVSSVYEIGHHPAVWQRKLKYFSTGVHCLDIPFKYLTYGIALG